MEKAGGKATCEFLKGINLGPILLIDIISHSELANEKYAKLCFLVDVPRCSQRKWQNPPMHLQYNSYQESAAISDLPSSTRSGPGEITTTTDIHAQKASVRELLHTVHRNGNQYSHYGSGQRSLRKLKVEPPCDPAVPLLGIYLKSPQSCLHKHISPWPIDGTTLHAHQPMNPGMVSIPPSTPNSIL